MSGRRIRALRLTAAPHRAALALGAGRFRPDLYRGGPGSPLRLAMVRPPMRPPGWVRVRPTLAGVCASDRKMLHLTGFGRAIFAHFGFHRAIIPGHEVVGVVTEADPGAAVQVGDRVVAEPLLACDDKRLGACRRCREGDDQVCEHLADAGDLAPGPGFGHDARYGGGWAEELVAPAQRVFRVPTELADRVAVLAEPFAVAVHAVARNLPAPGARVLVIGPGTIGLAVMAALEALAPGCQVLAAGVHPFGEAPSRAVGAAGYLRSGERGLVDLAADHLGATRRGNRLTGPVLDGGFDVVFDTIGSTRTIDDASRMCRARGRIVLIGTSARQSVDWTLVWSRELTLTGTAYYGEEVVPVEAGVAPGRRRAMQIALEVLDRARPALVTHVFPLEQSVAALRTADAGPAAESIKVAFDPSELVAT